jgi:hypothetical protein
MPDRDTVASKLFHLGFRVYQILTGRHTGQMAIVSEFFNFFQRSGRTFNAFAHSREATRGPGCIGPCMLAAPSAHAIRVFPEFQEVFVASSDVTALQQSDLNQFLYADIGTEANGMTLIVMSVFARLGADPWTEASRLAVLPKADAADSLASMIAGMPRSLWPLPDASIIAVRLIGLLPARPATATTAAIRQVTRRWPSSQIALAGVCVALIIACVFMMLKQ